MAEFGPSLTVWDEVEDLSIEDEGNEEYDALEDAEMAEPAEDV
jgi:hypothetical protein